MSNPILPQANKAEAILHIWNASFLIKSISGDSVSHIQTYKLKLLVSQLKRFAEIFFY